MNRYSIPRLMLHCALHSLMGSVFCFLLTFGSSYIMTKPWVYVLIFVLDIALYIVTVYTAIWKHGDKDHNLAQFGHITPDLKRGFYAGIPVSGFYFLTSLFMILSRAGCFAETIGNRFLVLFRVTCPQVWPLTCLPNPESSLMGISWGIILLSSLLAIAVPILTSGIAFIFGYRGVQLGEKMVYDKKDKE